MAAKMTDWKSDIITALLGTIYPSTRDDADLARRAGKEGLARLMETDGAKLDFVRDAVSSEIFQEACASSWHITIASDRLDVGRLFDLLRRESVHVYHPTLLQIFYAYNWPFSTALASLAVKSERALIKRWCVLSKIEVALLVTP